MEIRLTDKLGDVLLENHLLLPVINRFGIDLGFGDKSIKEICNDKDVDPAFFLEIINTFHNKNYFSQDKLKNFSVHQIIDYLKKTHDYYRAFFIPRVEKLLDDLINDCDENCSDLLLIRKFYNQYKKELEIHFIEEEEKVFPYVLELENVLSINGKWTFDPDISIDKFEKEHSSMDDKLMDLKNIIIRHLKPVYNNNKCNLFLFALFQFEQDLEDHARIEDHILVPIVREIENKLKS